MKRGLTIGLTTFLLLFYLGIVTYVFFGILHINLLVNFEIVMAFESIGFLLLMYFVLRNIFFRSIKTGYFVPLIMVTVLYTVVLNVINMACVISVHPIFLTLINFILLFVYCLLSIPMYIMGNR